MEFKGITWVGNVYQKFEAMCLEVEDVVCQETAKYVESQVQNVGVSVKKFYAEVMQDLLPPSSVVPIKDEDCGLDLDQKAAFGAYKKPKVSIKEDPAKEDPRTDDPSEIILPRVSSLSQERKDKVDICKRSNTGIKEGPIKKRIPLFKMSEDITSSGKDSSQSSLRSKVYNNNRMHPSVNPVIAADSRISLEQNDNDGMCRKLSIPFEKGPLKAHAPLPEVLELNAPAGKGTSRASSLSGTLKEDHDKACDTLSFPTSIEYPICFLTEKTGTSCSITRVEIDHVGDKSSDFPSSSSFLPPVSCDSKSLENGQSTSSGILLTESNGVGTCGAVSPMGFSGNEYEQFSEEKSDNNNSDMDEGNDIVELTLETIEEFHNAKLEESCIVVDSKELPFVPHRSGKHRSYKKKIRDALASRLRSAKKQEYEQLVTWHGDTNNQQMAESSNDRQMAEKYSLSPQSPLIGDLNSKKSSNHDFGESEWELL